MAQGFTSQLPVPLPVAQGGSGVVSNTSYAVLCGGTTSTNPIQSVASVGSAGEVLVSNGSGALPTFQGATGFFAYLAVAKTNVTGDGTLYSVPFDSLKYDTASGFDTTTGVYTIPKTGIWTLGYFLTLTNLNSSHTSGQIVIRQTAGGGQTYYGPRVNFAAIRRVTNDANTVSLPFSFDTNFSATDTVNVSVAIFNNTKTVGVIETSNANYQSCFFGTWRGSI